ncbi:MAG: SGNH/GDSL hydrolase family protein [Candidatus Palauibacterales bacterium]|nr:SGNH/GDSL hydrolase family protein [Candidatus Palauibacterales bacterium]
MVIHSRTSKKANVALLAGSLLIALLASEVLLRLLGMTSPVLYQSNSEWGYEPRPNQEASRLGVTVFINDLGLRETDPSRQLEGKPQILVLGNSVTYGGSRTEHADLFTTRLESMLRDALPSVEVLNGGVNGYSVTQMARRGRDLSNAVRADVLMFYTIPNDWERPPLQLIAPGNYAYPMQRPRSALWDLLRLSVNHLNGRYDVRGILPGAINRLWTIPENIVPPYDTLNVVSTNIDALLTMLADLPLASDSGRVAAIVFVAPSRSQVCDGIAGNNSDVVGRLMNRGVEVVDLEGDFVARLEGDCSQIGSYFWDDVHYRSRGHELVSRILFDRIACSDLLTPWALGKLTCPELADGAPASR